VTEGIEQKQDLREEGGLLAFGRSEKTGIGRNAANKNAEKADLEWAEATGGHGRWKGPRDHVAHQKKKKKKKMKTKRAIVSMTSKEHQGERTAEGSYVLNGMSRGTSWGLLKTGRFPGLKRDGEEG